MANKIKLLTGKVINGAVWLKGMEPPVSAAEARELVEAGEAEYVKPEKPAAKDTDSKES